MPKYTPPKSGFKEALDTYVNPKYASVFDSPLHSGLRSIAGLLGAGNDDPSVEAMGMVGPTAMAAEGLGPGATRAVKGLKGLYSRLTSALEARMPAEAHPSKVASIVKNFASPEEADMRSLSTLLAGKGNQKVTKEEVLGHLEQNPVELKVKELGIPKGMKTPGGNIPPENWDYPDVTPTKYSNYQVPGGENYKETLITLPPKEWQDTDLNNKALEDWYYKKYGSRLQEGHPEWLSPDVRQQFVNETLGPQFNSSHWDDPNVLVHTRSNDRTLAGHMEPRKLEVRPTPVTDRMSKDYPFETVENGEGVAWHMDEENARNFAERALPQEVPGPKGRFIEEIQSDWHQRGKKEGYQNPNPPPGPTAMEVDRAYSDFSNALHDSNTPEGPQGQTHPQVAALHQRWEELRRQYEESQNLRYDAKVPDAPFKESWPDLALKQQVLDTVEDPSLSWIGTSGADTQIRRYPDPANERGMAQFYDEAVPSKLRKILTPFGGKIEKGEIPGPPKKFIYRGRGEVGMPTFGPQHPENGWDPEPIAEVYPRYNQTKANQSPTYAREVGHQGDDLAREVSKSQSKLSAEPAWIAHLTPEMKDAIKKKGLPLLSLMGLFAPSNQGEQ